MAMDLQLGKLAWIYKTRLEVTGGWQTLQLTKEGLNKFYSEGPWQANVDQGMFHKNFYARN